MAVIANIHLSDLAAIEMRDNGKKTLRVLIPFDEDLPLSQSSRGKKVEKPTALILWFDDGMRVRTIMPTTETAFRAGIKDTKSTLIDLRQK